jgi:tyrosyl-tRNA synthetase
MNKDVEEVISRGVADFIDPDNTFKEKLLKKASGEYKGDIVIKHGIDPTRPDIHLGHAVILRRLRQFQDLGCKVIFLVGDFTARIGDPSGKSKVRPEIEHAEVEHNAKTYIDQVGKILRTDDPKLFSWIRNSDWFTGVTDINLPEDYKIEMEVKVDGKSAKINIPPDSFIGKATVFEQSRMQIKDLGLKDRVSVVTFSTFLWVLKHITHARLIERDMFQDRINSGNELYMHEMLYPVLQGVDSFVLAQIYGSCDLEIGGTDQTFNMLMGRDVMKANKITPQTVMSLEILPGTDGVEKMSKSLDNYIAITDTPREMFGKTMSIPDNNLETYFKLTTYTSLKEIQEIMKKVEGDKLNPRDAKIRLAREIVSIYHGEAAAKEAEENFIETFSNKGMPKDIETVKAAVGSKLVDILLSQKVVDSKTEWRRLTNDQAVTDMDSGEKITDPEKVIEKPATLRIGKHRFIKIELL